MGVGNESFRLHSPLYFVDTHASLSQTKQSRLDCCDDTSSSFFSRRFPKFTSVVMISDKCITIRDKHCTPVPRFATNITIFEKVAFVVVVVVVGVFR